MALKMPQSAGRRRLCRSRYRYALLAPRSGVSQAEIGVATLRRWSPSSSASNQLINAQVPVALPLTRRSRLSTQLTFNNNKRQFLQKGLPGCRGRAGRRPEPQRQAAAAQKMAEGSARHRTNCGKGERSFAAAYGRGGQIPAGAVHRLYPASGVGGPGQGAVYHLL